MKQKWLETTEEKESEPPPPHWTGSRKRCVWVSVYKSVSPRLFIKWVSSSGSLQDDVELPALKPAPHPLQASWSSDWAVPVCSSLTNGSRNPTTPTPPACPATLLPPLSPGSRHFNTTSSLKGAAEPGASHCITLDFVLTHVNHCRNYDTVCMRQPCLSATSSHWEDEQNSGLIWKESMRMGSDFIPPVGFSPLKVNPYCISSYSP